MLQTALVTVSKLYPPREGQKNWKAIGVDGASWSLRPDAASQLREGAVATFAYEDSVFNGKTYHMVKRVEFAGTMPVQPPAAPAQTQHVPSPSLMPFPGSAPAQAPRSGNGGHSTDKQIYVTGVVGRAMGSGKFEAPDIRFLTSHACDAWEEFFGG